MTAHTDNYINSANIIYTLNIVLVCPIRKALLCLWARGASFWAISIWWHPILWYTLWPCRQYLRVGFLGNKNFYIHPAHYNVNSQPLETTQNLFIAFLSHIYGMVNVTYKKMLWISFASHLNNPLARIIIQNQGFT